MLRIGIDLGGTKTEAIALDQNGAELARRRVDTIKGDYGATVRTITDLVQTFERELHQQGTVGVGIPGTIIQETGLVKNANSTWLNGKPLPSDLSQALGREVRCANDANCFAVSEATDGAARGAKVVFGAILGTGCGGGFVLRGHVHNGPNGLSGEWGHTPLPWPDAEEYPGPLCYCGRRGCLEMWISGTGFERDYRERTGNSRLGRDILAKVRQGNPEAVESFEKLKNRLARGLAVIVDVLDPDAIVLGGGLSNIDELYGEELDRMISEYTFGGNTKTLILKNQHGDSSGVRGAAWLWPATSPPQHT